MVLFANFFESLTEILILDIFEFHAGENILQQRVKSDTVREGQFWDGVDSERLYN